MLNIRRFILAGILMLALNGCSSPTTVNVGSLILPTSNHSIDVVQHRTDNKGCSTGFVIQTYDSKGEMIDSKGGFGRSLGCAVVDGLIRSSGQVGSAALIADGLRHSGSETNVSNSNSQSQGQGQLQGQSQGQKAYGGSGGAGGQGGQGGSGGSNGGGGGGSNGSNGNNGQGNGSGDGTNPGTSHHHNNGDNS